MISSFIMLFEVGLIALLLVLVFRMFTLARNDPFVPASVVTMVAGHQHSAQPHYQRLNRNAPLPLRNQPAQLPQTPVD